MVDNQREGEKNPTPAGEDLSYDENAYTGRPREPYGGATVEERARTHSAGRDPQNWHMGVGDLADYSVETGKGHYITYDEVIDILLNAEKCMACGGCEAACTRGTVDEAVDIDNVKAFIAQKDLEAEHRYVPEPVISSNRGRHLEKVVVIDAGPAGLSRDVPEASAMYTAEDKVKAILPYAAKRAVKIVRTKA